MKPGALGKCCAAGTSVVTTVFLPGTLSTVPRSLVMALEHLHASCDSRLDLFNLSLRHHEINDSTVHIYVTTHPEYCSSVGSRCKPREGRDGLERSLNSVHS